MLCEMNAYCIQIACEITPQHRITQVQAEFVSFSSIIKIYQNSKLWILASRLFWELHTDAMHVRS